MAEQQELSLVQRIAKRFNIGATDRSKILDILRNTAFPQGKKYPPLSDPELFTALVLVDSYGLDPFAKQISAFRSEGRLQIVVTIDGWAKIISTSKEINGIEVEYGPELDEEVRSRFTELKATSVPEFVQVKIYRKGWEHPFVLIERFTECYRNTAPWNAMPYRVLRHKGISQAARIALGVSAVDPDEAKDIGLPEMVDVETEEPKADKQAKPKAIEKGADPVTVELPKEKERQPTKKDVSWM